mgnify:CR=1 FL=1
MIASASNHQVDAMAPIDTVVFDIGNVLIPWNPRWLFGKMLTDEVALDRFLHEVDFSAWNAQHDAGQSFARGIAELGARFPHYRHLLQAYFDRWEECIAEPSEEAVALPRQLRAAGYRTLALTNFSTETFPRAVRLNPFLNEFEGIVVSDWGAVDDRVAAVAAGLDLEMPSSNGLGPAAIVAAVDDGVLSEAALDECAGRVVALALAAGANAVDTSYDRDAQHELAVTIARRCIVLLQNQPIDGRPVLPLTPSGRLAVIGEFARTPRYQGGGSSKVNPTQVDAALDAIAARAAHEVVFEPGFTLDGSGEPDLAARAVHAARTAEVVLVFLGVPAGDESEGFDRTDWQLPPAQLRLLEQVLAVNPRTVVVLSHGSVVDLAQIVAAPAVVDGLLLGEGGGTALADILFGFDDPSGRLAETIPLRLADGPAYLDFPGELLHVRYGEGVFVGYRWYDAREIPVQFPFGHGLSYTTTTFTEITATPSDVGVDVGVTVTNTGERAGRVVVQVYAGLERSVVARPPRELKGMAALAVAAGERRRVTVTVPRAELAYWDRRAGGPAAGGAMAGGWVVEGGDYRIDVGHSSRDIDASVTVTVVGDSAAQPLSLDSTLSELLAVPAGRAAILGQMRKSLGLTEIDPALEQLIGSIPLRRVVPMMGIDPAELEALLARG